MEKNIIIIGAGASGMMAGIAAARALADTGTGCGIYIMESNMEPGRKILATGNGRCNLTNRHFNWENAADDGKGPIRVLEKYDYRSTLDLFCSMGLLTRTEEEGRVYPYSGQASAVRAALENECRRLGIQIMTDITVKKLEKIRDGFNVYVESEDEPVCCSCVLVAAGGRAGLQYGSTGDGYGFAKSFGHRLNAPRPALVPLVSEEAFLTELKGVRAKGQVTLYRIEKNTETIDKGAKERRKEYKQTEKQRKVLAVDQGEIQFNSGGISGICVLNVSRFVERDRGPYQLVIDFVPEMSADDLENFIRSGLADSKMTIDEVLTGIVNQKLVPVIREITERGRNQDMPARLVSVLKGFPVNITGTKGWKEAQTTAGGIYSGEINFENMESRIVDGLFFAGEVLDVDGICGGYNLQWAWSSGRCAGQGMAEYIQNL